MKRIVRLEIDHCLRCPHSGSDINVTRTECKKACGKMICWDGDSIETRSAYIPEWCPLWLAQGKPMWKPNNKIGGKERGKNMKIRLTIDLPIAPVHGATKGRVFDVIAEDEPGRGKRVYFIGDAGEECAALRHEYSIESDAESEASQ